MKKYTIERPRLDSIDKDKLVQFLFSDDHEKDRDFYSHLIKAENPEYLYWDKIKYKGQPSFLQPEEFWYLLKISRKNRSKQSPIKDKKDNYFKWIKLDRYDEFFHLVDLHAGGELFSFKKDVDEKQKMKFISRGILEEAIASSQLEGANTSRKVAKEMIRAGRKPRNKSEQMILNNYLVMQEIENDYKNKTLDMDLLLELHRKITQDTLEDPKDAGQLDNDQDRVAVFDEQDELLHEPPSMNIVKQELMRFIQLANDQLKPSHFVHPVAHAIMLHFWIGYLHPFVDGNGRLARVIFYWYLLRHKYWAFAYLPISKLVKKSPGQYKKAYIYSEQDDNDLTYFVDYNIRIVQLAMRDFQEYINSQYQKNLRLTRSIVKQYNFNSRQIELLQYLGKKDDHKRTQTKVYQKIHQISVPTAIGDLKRLEEQGFLRREKEGRNVYYYPTEKIQDLY